MPDETTLTQRIVRAAELHKAREPGPIEAMLSTAFSRLISGVVCLGGLGVIPLHQMKHDDAPEISLIVLTVVLVLLGLSGVSPGGVKLAGATAKQFLPAKWRGNGNN